MASSNKHFTHFNFLALSWGVSRCTVYRTNTTIRMGSQIFSLLYFVFFIFSCYEQIVGKCVPSYCMYVYTDREYQFFESFKSRLSHPRHVRCASLKNNSQMQLQNLSLARGGIRISGWIPPYVRDVEDSNREE